MPKAYDQAYFDRWYRGEGFGSSVRLERKVSYALAATEYLLERRVRTVLDVGCGEGPLRGGHGRLPPATPGHIPAVVHGGRPPWWRFRPNSRGGAARMCDAVPVWQRVDGMRAFGLGRPGEMRDRLNALVIAGTKTATAGLVKFEYEPHGEVAEHVGERQVALDSDGRMCAVVEVTRVETLRFVDVAWEFADAEGEGFQDIDHWREGHRSYYRGEGIEIFDGDDVVCVWFQVVESNPSS